MDPWTFDPSRSYCSFIWYKTRVAAIEQFSSQWALERDFCDHCWSLSEYEYVTSMHSSGMRTAHFSGRRVGRGVCVPFTETPLSQRSPFHRDPLHRDLHSQRSPWRETPLGGRHFPTEGTWDQAARKEVTSYRDPPHPPLWTEWLTHACENIILPKTSFAGGNYPWIELCTVHLLHCRGVCTSFICKILTF